MTASWAFQVVWFVTCFSVILLGVDKGLVVGLICAIMAVIVQLSRYGGVVRGLARGRGRGRRGKRGSPYDRLYREAPHERGPFD